MANIQPVSDRGSAESNWIALNGDPEFALDGLERFRGRWVRLKFRLQIDHNESSGPRLYFDIGTRFSDAEAIQFPRAATSTTEIELVFHVPVALRSARLRPTASLGKFSIGPAFVHVMRKQRAAGHMLRAIAAADGFARAAVMLTNAVLRTRSTARRLEARHRIVKRYMEIKVCAEKSYADWIKAFEPQRSCYEALAGEHRNSLRRPKISVVLPVYNPSEEFLRSALDSVCEQVYENWELCIADDCSTESYVRPIIAQYAQRDSRIRVCYRDKTGHISEASNSALALATGEWVALFDNDDRLHPLALHFVADVIVENPGVSLIFSDEDKIDEAGRRSAPYFKCDFNYELLLAHNMICHLAVFRRKLLTELGGFRCGFEGAQDYDLVLRASEKLSSAEILHVPRILYHWRAHARSTALDLDAKPYAAAAARKAVAAHLQRRGIRAIVTSAPEAPDMNRVRYELPAPAPAVSIVICTRDRADLLGRCLDSIVRHSTYDNYEVLIVDNGSVEEETLRLFDRLPSERFSVIRDDSPFNFSALNNRAAKFANGDFLCLLNNDVEIITADWIEELLSFAVQPGVGAVGARLWYPGGGLQHGGVILGQPNVIQHPHRNLRRGLPGYFGRAVVHQSFSAVTGAALMVKKSIYEEVGGLDEDLPVAFNDTDFCLRVRAAGYRNVWTPYAEMIHHESASRGCDTASHGRAPAERESLLMRERWSDLLGKDPAYSLNLSIETDDLRIAWPPRIDTYQYRAANSRHESAALDA